MHRHRSGCHKRAGRAEDLILEILEILEILLMIYTIHKITAPVKRTEHSESDSVRNDDRM